MTGFDRQGRGNVRFSRAGIPNQNHRLSLLDVLAAHQFGHQHPVERRLSGEVEILQRFVIGESCGL
jgi:hypothetical protein